MSIIETIINKALSFEGVAENPAGSNNVQFNTLIIMGVRCMMATLARMQHILGVLPFYGMFSDYVGPPTFSVMGKKLRQRYTFMTIIIMGGYFPQDRLVTLY